MRLNLLANAALFALITLAGYSVRADVNFNAPRVNREPGWSGPALLGPEEKEANKTVPILERSYRPGHVYGNMVRRHHYRDTVIPSHRDRVEMLETLRTKQPSNGKYVKDNYR